MTYRLHRFKKKFQVKYNHSIKSAPNFDGFFGLLRSSRSNKGQLALVLFEAMISNSRYYIIIRTLLILYLDLDDLPIIYF